MSKASEIRQLRSCGYSVDQICEAKKYNRGYVLSVCRDANMGISTEECRPQGRQVDRALICNLLHCKKTLDEIIATTGASRSTIYNIAKMENISFTKRRDWAEVSNLRNDGYTIDQICELLQAVNKEQRAEVLRICREIGKPITKEEKQLSLQHEKILKTHDETWAKNYIKEKSNSNLEYINGYKTMDDSVVVKCTNCGIVFEKSMISFRASPNPGCPECKKLERIKTALIRESKKETERRERRFREANRIRQKLINACSGQQIEFRICDCGELMLGRANCCEKCKKRKENKINEVRRRTRIQTAMVDRDITVDKLYKRDGGICQICGKQCDFSDCLTKDGIFYAGNNYPSIDHIKPLAKGGLHSWNNVQLAHRFCNSIKGDRYE